MDLKPKLDRFKLFDLVEAAAKSKWKGPEELKKILPVVLTSSAPNGGNLSLCVPELFYSSYDIKVKVR